MSLGTANSSNSSVTFKQIPLCMEKPWVVCQGSPFLCKHWWCSWSSKARHCLGGWRRHLSIKPHPRTIFFPATWNGEISKITNTAPPTQGWTIARESDREQRWTWVVFITTSSPGWLFRDKVGERYWHCYLLHIFLAPGTEKQLLKSWPFWGS